MKSSKNAISTLAETIKSHRKALDLSQQEVADLSGVSVNFLRQIEEGKETAQIGKVLEVMTALGLQLCIQVGTGRIVDQVRK